MREVLQNNSSVFVSDFGARGDGITDDTLAIKKAQSSGKTLFFPEGVFLISEPLMFQNTNIKGSNDSTIKLSNTYLFEATSDNNDVEIGISNVKIIDSYGILRLKNQQTGDDFNIDYSISLKNVECDSLNTLILSASSPNNTKGLQFLEIESCKFTNFTGIVLDLYSVRNNNISIRNNYVNNAKSGFKLGYRFESQNEFGFLGNVHIESNTIKNLNDVSDANAISVIGANNCIIKNNYIENVYSDDNTDAEAIYTKSINTIIDSNILHNAGGNQGAIIQKGLSFGNFVNQITNNKIYFTDAFIANRNFENIGITTVTGGALIGQNIIENCAIGISVSDNDNSSIVILDNIIKSKSSNNVYGILIENIFKSVVIKNNLIIDLTATNNAFGIYFSQNCNNIEDIIIRNNDFKNITGTNLAACVKNASANNVELFSISNNHFINSTYCIDHDNSSYGLYNFKDNIGKSITYSQGTFTYTNKIHKDNIINNVYLSNLDNDVIETFSVKLYTSHSIALADVQLPTGGRYRLTGSRSIYHKF